MKHIKFLLIIFSFILSQTFSYAQEKIEDTIVKLNGESMSVNVTNITEKEILFTYPNENVVNSIKKKLVKEIHFRSGRVQEISKKEIAGLAYHGFSLGLSAGYGFASPSENLGIRRTYNTVENVKGSYGAGLNITVDPSYKFSENIGVELALNYLMGSTYNFSDDNANYWEKISATMIRIMPCVKLSMGGKKNIDPYAKLGLVVGINGKIKYETVESSGHEYFELTDGLSWGWIGTFGIGIKIKDNMKLNTEIAIISQTWGPEKLENIKKMSNYPSTLNPPIALHDSYSFTATDTRLKSYYPFNSLGINVGLQIGFGKN